MCLHYANAAWPVGYGDLIPTSWLGRMVAVIVAMSGIVVLALPIGIIGGNFAELYDDFKFAQKMGARLKLDTLDVEAMVALFQRMDSDGNEAIDIFDIKFIFEEHRMKIDSAKLLHYFSTADRLGTGKLTLSEFIFMCKLIQVCQCV